MRPGTSRIYHTYWGKLAMLSVTNQFDNYTSNDIVVQVTVILTEHSMFIGVFLLATTPRSQYLRL